MRIAYVPDGSVDTEEVGALADDVLAVATECAILSADVSAARLITAAPRSAARWASSVGAEVERAADLMATAADHASELSTALSAAANLYVNAESTISGLFDAATSMTGAFVGSVFSRMMIPLLGVAAIVAAPAIPAVLASAASPEVRNGVMRTARTLGGGVARWLAEHPEAARNPLTMLVVRGLVSGSDDVVKTALGMPQLASPFLNDPRLSVPGAAMGLGALGVAGLRESPVQVVPVHSGPAVAPKNISDVAARIPEAGPGDPQIRIEKYTDGSGNDSWAVYVSGTVDMGVGEGSEAFDMESNAALMADADGGAYTAVAEAMDDAGIAAEDPVMIAGHSQGGLVAERVAQSGDYSVQTLITFGAPSTDAPLPDSVSAYAVEHRGDVVPALGGFVDGGGDRVVISADIPPDEQGPSAHARSEYEKTAAAMDVSADPKIADLQQAIADVGVDAESITVTDYRADRVTSTSEPQPRTPEPVPGGPHPGTGSGPDNGDSGAGSTSPDSATGRQQQDTAEQQPESATLRDPDRRQGEALRELSEQPLGDSADDDGAHEHRLATDNRDEVYGFFDGEVIRRFP